MKVTIISQLQQVAENEKKNLPPLTDDLVLLDSKLDSLAIAILVARRGETLRRDLNPTTLPIL